MSDSRTKRASRNIVIGFLSKFIIMIFAFATKTIFVRLLGVEYNGVNGLYSNILSILALSELGVGNVLNYSLYSALRENDTEKVKVLVKYFKKIYYVIAAVICIIGISLIPFLHYIIKSDLSLEKLIEYYVLYLLNSVVSYFVVYKTTVIIADQNNYISSICETSSALLMHIAQIVYLIFFKDFFGYLVIQVSFTIIKNVVLSFITDRKYPYLKELNSFKSTLSKNEKTKILENIKSTFLYKISAVILNNTDNILISIIVGTVYVGYYSNYNMIVSYIVILVGIFITGITASLGSLNSENNNEASYRMFNILCLIFSFIGTIEMCCLVNCFQQFIPIWIGSENVMDFSWVIVISLNLYLTTLMNPIWMFRETMGLFKQVRYILLITAGINILFSIILGKLCGVPGILAATFVSKLVSQYWYEPRILFKKFEKPVHRFYLNQLKQLLIMVIAVLVTYIICNYLGNSLFWVFIRAIVSAIVAIVLVYLLNIKNLYMDQLLITYIKPMLNRFVYKFSRRNEHDGI